MATKNLKSIKFPGLPDTYEVVAPSAIASDYSSSSTYAVGDYVWYDGDLYRCVSEISTAEAWTSGHWTEVALADEVEEALFAVKGTTEFPNFMPAVSATKVLPQGVTTTYNNGNYTCVGTSTGAGGRGNRLIQFTLPAGTYIAKRFYTENSDKGIPDIFLQKEPNDTIVVVFTNGGNSFTLTTDTVVHIGSNVVNATEYAYSAKLQIMKANGVTYYVPPTGTAVDNVMRPYVEELLVDVDDLDERVSNLEEGRSPITPTWNVGYYVNNSAHGLTPYSNFYYSDSIELTKGEGIKVAQGYSNTATVVDMLSRWTSDGTYAASIYPYPTTGYCDSTVYRATEEKEYIRVCFYNYNNEVSNKIQVFKYAPQNDWGEDIGMLESLTIAPSISMFERVGFCGDSYVKGQLYNSGGVVGDFPSLSWGKNIGRMYGITADIFASSGADTNTFQSRSDCLPALLASANPCGLYVFCMGINDASYVTLGSMDDITDYESYTQYPNTFYGNYGKIIEQVLGYSANSKIILMTPYHPNYNARYVTPLEEISTHYGIAMINTEDSKLCSSSTFTGKLVGGHPTSVLHSAMARDIANLIAECIDSNYSYFKTYMGA